MRKSFTLLEVLVTVIIILILATLGIAGYRQVVDDAYKRVCGTNQAVIMRGIRQHFLETGVAPATLGEIKPEHLHKAYVEVMKEIDWPTKFSYFVVRLNQSKYAYAQIEKMEDLMKWEKMHKYNIPPETFQCPADHTSEGISYGISPNLSIYDSWEKIPIDEVILGDSDSYILVPAYRHFKNFGTKKVTQQITKGGNMKKDSKSQPEKGKEPTPSQSPRRVEGGCVR